MKFNFRALTQSPERLNVVTAKLGADSDNSGFKDIDTGKPMKMGTAGNFQICAAGDEIEGWLDNVDGGPTADGMTIGGVASGNRGLRVRAYLAAAANANVLDYVVAGTNAAIGAAHASGLGVVKPAFESDGTTKKTSNWRIIAFENDAAAGFNTIAVLERQ